MTDFSPEAVDAAIKEKKMTKRAAVQKMPVPAPQQLTLSDALYKAALDPAIDPAKMRELLAIKREIDLDQDRREFQHHMAACQQEIGPIAADAANPQTQSRYASLAALDAALRPHYTAHGFSVSYDSGASERGPEFLCVTCRVSRGSYHEDHRAHVRPSTKGAKGNDVMTMIHADGSGLSYGKRYALALAFNVAVSRDDDGNRAGARSLTRTQVEELETLALDCNVSVEAFLPIASEHLGYEIKQFGEIHRADFHRVRSSILARKKEKQG